MSDEAVELARASVDACNRGDRDWLLDHIDDDFAFDWTRSRRPPPGLYRGPDGLTEFLREQWETFESFVMEPREFIDRGRHVVIPNTVHAQGRNGIEASVGLEQARFEHLALVEIDHWAAATLRMNRPSWDVFGPDGAASSGPSAGDVHAFDARPYEGQVDLLAGGVPCPPFSKAGKQLGPDDERDLFPEALRIVAECKPRVVMLENVRGLLDPKFARYREGHVP